jgi:hypothetical protein
LLAGCVNGNDRSTPLSSAVPQPAISPTPTPSESVSPTPAPAPYAVIDEAGKTVFSLEGDKIFKPANLPPAKIDFEAADLLFVLRNTREYFRSQSQFDPQVLQAGILRDLDISIDDVLQTLDFSIESLEVDIKNGRSIRMKDPEFLRDNFQAISWTAHNPKSLQRKEIRITKYAVFTHPGSRTRTKEFNTGLYALKSIDPADKLRLQYTKQDILTDIYESGGKEFGKVEPLVYLTREGMEEALMEGTIKVTFNDGSTELFNVDKSNEIPYVKELKRTEQKRYWYFRKVDNIKGYGHSIDSKISIKPGVTFAGDIKNIGLGKLIAIEHKIGNKNQLKLGAIADTGGAFLPNLYQLDFLAGIFDLRQDFDRYSRTLPEFTNAYILIKKKPAP